MYDILSLTCSLSLQCLFFCHLTFEGKRHLKIACRFPDELQGLLQTQHICWIITETWNEIQKKCGTKIEQVVLLSSLVLFTTLLGMLDVNMVWWSYKLEMKASAGKKQDEQHSTMYCSRRPGGCCNTTQNLVYHLQNLVIQRFWVIQRMNEHKRVWI